MLIAVLALVVVGVWGFWSMGLAMTHLHVFTHIGGLKRNGTPSAIAMYGWLHLDHHRDIPRKLKISQDRPTLRGHFQRGARGWRDVQWCVTQLKTSPRWAAVRMLIALRGARVGLVVAAMAALVLDPIASVAIGLAALLGSILGAAALMLWYDLTHLWTHANGPRVSRRHGNHHGDHQVEFGMWDWSEISAPRRNRWVAATVGDVRFAQRLVRWVRPHVTQGWDAEAQRIKTAYQAACTKTT